MNMRYHIKKYFIPGKHNEYKPHFFRLAPVLVTASVIAFLFVIAAALNAIVIRSGSSELAAVVSSTLVDLANADRKDSNLSGLAVSSVLERAAQLKANDMAAKGYFAHNSPEGVTPWHWFEEAGYNFSFAGENLAVYFSDSAELERAWMNSPLHRANILNSSFTEIGIATAKGVYQGRETVYVVQEFGRPKRGTASLAHTGAAALKNISAPAATAASKVAIAETKDAHARVKGVTAEKEPLTVVSKEDTFIAVQNGAFEPEEKEGESVAQTPTLLKAAASPWTLLRMAYGVIAACIVLALLLMVGVEIKRQHPRHIAYGVLLLVFMAVLLYAWKEVFFGEVAVI